MSTLRVHYPHRNGEQLWSRWERQFEEQNVWLGIMDSYIYFPEATPALLSTSPTSHPTSCIPSLSFPLLATRSWAALQLVHCSYSTSYRSVFSHWTKPCCTLFFLWSFSHWTVSSLMSPTRRHCPASFHTLMDGVKYCELSSSN